MSLTSALGSATSGLLTVQARISVANANISNASETGYTRKSYQSTATASSAVSQDQVVRAANAYLSRTVIGSAATSGRDSVVSEYLDLYDAALGTTDGGDDLSSLLTDFASALSTLAASPSEASAQTGALNALQSVAQTLKDTSGEVQSLRTQADSQIADTVSSINDTLASLASLNDQISQAKTMGLSTADLEDRRDTALESLSSQMGVSYYTGSDSRVVVYSSGGDLLLGSQAATLSYTAASRLDSTSTYPGLISGITLNGKDVTGSFTSGTLGGLIALRDGVLPAEEAKLDALAAGLIEQVNAAANTGSPSPAPGSLTSAATVSASDAFSATGSASIALVNSSGSIVSSTTLNLSAYATLGDLVSALDAIDGLSAAIGADGKLTLSADSSGNGVAIGAGTSSVGANSVSLSAWFGFNDILSGSSARDIAASATASSLPTAVLSSTGLASGDGSAAQAIADALDADVSFTKSGDLEAQKTSLLSYAAKVVASAANVISAASDKAADSASTYSYASTSLSNQTSVNLDEELANLTALQTQYSANAQMISTVKELFEVLLNMVS